MHILRYLLIYILLLLTLSPDLSAAETEPMLSFPVNTEKPLEYYFMQFDNSVTRPPMNLELPLKTFKRVGKVRLKPGTELKVSSFIIAEKLVAIVKMLTWKTQDNMPDLDTLRDSLDDDGRGLEDSVDKKKREAFFQLLKRLSEERRFAKDQKEFETHLEAQSTDQTEKRGHFNPYLYPTGFIEVSGDFMQSAAPGTHYFVRIKDALGSSAKLNTTGSKLKIVQGLTLYLLKELGPKSTNPALAKADSAIQKICDPESCPLVGDRPVGKFIVDTLMIFMAGKWEFSDPIPEAKLAEVYERQQLCILKRLSELCPGLVDLKTAGEIIEKKGNLDCENPDSITENK